MALCESHTREGNREGSAWNKCLGGLGTMGGDESHNLSSVHVTSSF